MKPKPNVVDTPITVHMLNSLEGAGSCICDNIMIVHTTIECFDIILYNRSVVKSIKCFV